MSENKKYTIVVKSSRVEVSDPSHVQWRAAVYMCSHVASTALYSRQGLKIHTYKIVDDRKR